MPEPIAKQDFRAKQKAADNFLTMELVNLLKRANINDKKVISIIKTGLLIKIAVALFEIHNLGKNYTIVRESDVIKGCGGNIKWMLIRSYFRDYAGTRFPRIYAERYCVADTGYKSSAVQEKFDILSGIDLIHTLKSEHIDCDDIHLREKLIDLMNSYYALQAHAYTKGNC